MKLCYFVNNCLVKVRIFKILLHIYVTHLICLPNFACFTIKSLISVTLRSVSQENALKKKV